MKMRYKKRMMAAKQRERVLSRGWPLPPIRFRGHGQVRVICYDTGFGTFCQPVCGNLIWAVPLSDDVVEPVPEPHMVVNFGLDCFDEDNFTLALHGSGAKWNLKGAQ